MKPIHACIAAAALFASIPAHAFDETQTRDIEKIVRDYLVAHPEVLLEAIDALEAKRTAEMQASRSAAIASVSQLLTTTPNGTAAGNPAGDVTITEFFDYNCGYCKRAASDMEVLVAADPKLRVVLKEVPVLGPDSEAATRVSLAFRALAPDRYPAYQKALLASRERVDQERALAVAADYDVARERLLPLLQSETVTSVLAESAHLLDTLGISGTPTYVVGGELVSGAVGADALAKRIANVRQCGKASC
ncbi:DsbA family protein [Aureimonas sp. AU4]|uniref:DsbA family protein n=1 Tax=Aureimonas sp. AU4 TaxID=1638163 RepID=UPI000706C885|nr:DsbA family protein [Aureimonas sp. AU4]BAT30710.1 DSBA oxidoreductase [Aureimonas sp. AU4]